MIIHDRVIDDEYIIHYLKSKSYADSIRKRITFYNCKFTYRFIDTVFNGSKFINCTFTNGSFTVVRFNKCTFESIIFEDNPRQCFIKCALLNCSYDEAFEQSFAETAPCPDKGEFVAWKKAFISLENNMLLKDRMKRVYGTSFIDCGFMYSMPCIIKLLIPEDAKRSCAFSNKCRCDKAKVLDIQDLSGDYSLCYSIAHSNYDPTFKYNIGETITPKTPFDTNPFNECSSGIHFFMSREEAVNYR